MMSKVEKELKCKWNLGTDCDGKVTDKKLFKDQINIPICEKHFEEHKYIIALMASGLNGDDVLEMSPDQRKKEGLLLNEQDEKLMDKIDI